MNGQAKRKRQTQYWSAIPDPVDFTSMNSEAAWDGVDARDPLPDDDADSRDDWAWARGVCVLHSTQDLPVAVQRTLDQHEWLFYARHGDRDHVYDVQNDLAAEAHRQRPVPSKPRKPGKPSKPSKPRVNLSRSDIATLPFRRQGGETLRNIAADLGVSHVTIYRALKRTAHA